MFVTAGAPGHTAECPRLRRRTTRASAYVVRYLPGIALPSNMTTGKRHHYRPESHLKRFADTDGKVWTYPVLGKPYKTTPKNVGVEGQLYQTEATPIAAPNARVEEWISRAVDDPIAPILLRLARGDSSVDSEDVAKLAIYFAAQDMRTPMVRDLIARSVAQRIAASGKSTVEATVEDYERARGPLPCALRREALQIPEPSIKNAWLQMMMKRTIGTAAVLFDNSRFTMFRSPSAVPWISNDQGIVKFAADFDRSIPFVTGLRESQHWLIAISPEFAVTMAPKAMSTRHRMTPFSARRINCQMVRDAALQVYSCDAAA